jgi:hypothetical protein
MENGLEKLLTSEASAARNWGKPLPSYDSIFKARMALKLGKMPPAERQASLIQPQRVPAHRDFLTIPEIAERWRIARPTVYNRLRSARVKVLDFASHTGRGRKLVPVGEVLKIEGQQFKRL